MAKYKTLGAITIDEENQRFKIDGDFGGKSGLGKKLVKGTLAVGTLGMSVAAEKVAKGAAKAFNDNWIPFGEYMEYSVRRDNEIERVSSGIRFKGIRSGGSKVKTVTKQMDIVVKLDSLDHPIVTIPVIKKPLSGKAFDEALKYADDTTAALDYIQRHR